MTDNFASSSKAPPARPPDRLSSEHDICSSAAQPAAKKQRVQGEVLENMGANNSMGFVSCPMNMQLHTDEGLQTLKEAVVHVLDLGCMFLAVTCEKKGVDMSRILHQLMPVMNKLDSSVAQPAVRPFYSFTETTISFWSNSFGTCYDRKSIDPEGGVPATGFFFDTNVGKIAIFTTVWPPLPCRTKKRLLEAYVKHTGHAIQTMIVGGSMHCNFLAAENLSTRIDSPINFHVHGTLSLFVSRSNPQNVSLHDIHTENPYSVLAELVSSAEQSVLPACCGNASVLLRLHRRCCQWRWLRQSCNRRSA